MPVGENSLSFVHLKLPHLPLQFTPDSHRYFGGTLLMPNNLFVKHWVAGESAISFIQHRHLWQAGYADRIGERLREADARATAVAASDANLSVTALAPILARRSDAVDTEFRRLFPTTRSTRSRTVDAHGWHAGRDAADNACLTSPSDRVSR